MFLKKQSYAALGPSDRLRTGLLRGRKGNPMMKSRKIFAVILAALMLVSLLAACRNRNTQDTGAASEASDTAAASEEIKAADTEAASGPETAVPETTEAAASEPETTEAETTEASTEAASESPSETQDSEPAPAEKNGDVYILFTSDIHCGVNQGFGLSGLYEVRENLEKQGYTTLLVDDGDAIQGEVLGTLSSGEAMVKLMNAMHYDAAIPGNHEFDYGMDRFLELTEIAEYPYISCNLTREGAPVFAPYVILEAAGMKIAFVGITTPKTITSSTPKYFQNEDGEYIYSFLQDEDGTALYEAVQNAVDAARGEGADYVYVMGHLGLELACEPWTYADVISHTNGIDVFLDGHSHDTEQIVMKNKDGDDVVRSACGTKLSCIGYSHISAEQGIVDTGIWSWPNKTTAEALFGIENEVSAAVSSALSEMEEITGEIVAKSTVDLTIHDPEATDESGNPIRMVRRAETNLGDLCADAFLAASGADIAVMNGGGIRTSLKKGDISYGDIISVFPFGNEVCVIDVTGQQVLDALEWGSRNVPGESGGFLQVAGMSYELDVTVENSCISDENNMCVGIEGPRRVKNVLIGGEPIDPEKHYSLAGTNYTLLENGDGMTAFDGSEVLNMCIKIDNQILIDYITETLGGEIGGEYADPYGQGRIVILEE